MTHQARKRFGQNFLHDQSIIKQILAYAQPKAGQHWLEIGPGQGALTKPLLQAQVKLDVIELDRDLVSLLEKQYAEQTNLSIHSADALKFDFNTLVQGDEKLHIIGNLPYNISTPLMFHILESTQYVADMHFMLQKEVVDRICAEPGSKTYGRLSVMMAYFCEPEWLFDVPPESFYPVPQVTSAIVRLVPHQTPPVQIKSLSDFQHLVTQAFCQRRKTIRNSLKNLVSEEKMLALGIEPSLRAEALGLQEFALLANALE